MIIPYHRHLLSLFWLIHLGSQISTQTVLQEASWITLRNNFQPCRGEVWKDAYISAHPQNESLHLKKSSTRSTEDMEGSRDSIRTQDSWLSRLVLLSSNKGTLPPHTGSIFESGFPRASRSSDHRAEHILLRFPSDFPVFPFYWHRFAWPVFMPQVKR